jgi:hypothetical protein
MKREKKKSGVKRVGKQRNPMLFCAACQLKIEKKEKIE